MYSYLILPLLCLEEEKRRFRAIYADLQNKLNPDDIDAELFSAGLLTESEMDDISSEHTKRKKMSILLSAVRRSIALDPAKYNTFFGILDSIDKYKPIVAKAMNIPTP